MAWLIGEYYERIFKKIWALLDSKLFCRLYDMVYVS